MTTATGFVPTEEIRQLTYGSFEHLRARVEESLEESSSRLFGKDAPFQVLGTFQGYAIVLSEDARLFRVKFQESDVGEIKIVGAEQISVPVYSASNMDQFLIREAKSVVDAFLKGSVSVAHEKLRGLAHFAKDTPCLVPEKVVESFATMVRGERPWKRLYAERANQIRSVFTKEEAKKLDQDHLVSKFHALYDGTVQESDHSGYRDLVLSDLNYLSGRIDSLLGSTNVSLKLFNDSRSKLRAEDTDPLLSMFESFSEDFGQDLVFIKRALTEAMQHLGRVDELGKVYDVLAEALHSYEVAGRFVEKMSRRLSEVSTEEK